MEYQICPVCKGSGQVSGGFYDHPGYKSPEEWQVALAENERLKAELAKARTELADTFQND